MGQPIFIPEIYFGQSHNFLVAFRSFLNLHPPAVRSLANTGFARKKNLFAFVCRKNSPAPSILPLFLLLIPIIVKIFYDQSKLDVFLIHEIRQKTATCWETPHTKGRRKNGSDWDKNSDPLAKVKPQIYGGWLGRLIFGARGKENICSPFKILIAIIQIWRRLFI